MLVRHVWQDILSLIINASFVILNVFHVLERQKMIACLVTLTIFFIKQVVWIVVLSDFTKYIKLNF
jgi:hypothetical protein